MKIAVSQRRQSAHLLRVTVVVAAVDGCCCIPADEALRIRVAQQPSRSWLFPPAHSWLPQSVASVSEEREEVRARAAVPVRPAALSMRAATSTVGMKDSSCDGERGWVGM